MRSSVLALAMVACVTCLRRTETPDAGPPPRAPDSSAPSPDRDGIGTPLGDACANLRRLGCPEGSPDRGRTCFENLTLRGVLVTVPIVCVADANSSEALRACGDDRTLRFRCAP
jgi:hypothetical protein